MSTYFKNFPAVSYNFGSNIQPVAFQNLTAYVDIIDQVKDNLSFYRNFYIQEGDRPDQVSYQIYNSTDYYWTFFLLNNTLREQGWPLSFNELEMLVNREYPDTVVETKDVLTGIFKVGQTVTGSSSGETGIIRQRNLDLGQIVITGAKSFTNNEVLTSQVGEEVQSITLISAASEKNSTRFWRNGDNTPQDIDPHADRPSIYTPVTNLEYYIEENDKLKEIKVLKPDVVRDIFNEFQDQFING